MPVGKRPLLAPLIGWIRNNNNLAEILMKVSTGDSAGKTDKKEVFMDRKEVHNSIKTHAPDVLIVGGGINGVGTFRDLALNGVNVLLVERSDFCSGASAASSHMAHGGIRYLENGEFRLVREAVQERNRMIGNAPHLVRPLPTAIPIFKVFSGLLNAPLKFLGWLEKPSERGALVIKIGLIFYDAFTRAQKTVPTHRFVGRKKALSEFPGMNPDVRFVATYYDGSIISPERLTVELLLEGEAEGDHARALNYVSMQAVNDRSVSLKDEMTGEIYNISPKLIINAAGPWIDRANQDLGITSHYIGGTKGSHLVLHHDELHKAIGDHEIFFENKDGRIVLIFPLRDKVLIGTSDLPIDDPDDARCTREEIDYFLGMLARVFPNIKVDPSQVVFRISGVRPLAHTQAKNAGQITRDHHIQEDRLGIMPVYSLVGGKWTSYRAFSAQVTDRALAVLGLQRRAETSCLPIGGGRDFPSNQDKSREFLDGLERSSGLPRKQIEVLFRRYGTRAVEVGAFMAAGKDTPIAACPNFSYREILYLVQKEKIMHLDDLLLRRTLLAYLGELSLPLIEEMAAAVGAGLGWDESARQLEVARTLDILADKHGVTF
jgi:glycerol-3-phosphate dehydrogenase